MMEALSIALWVLAYVTCSTVLAWHIADYLAVRRRVKRRNAEATRQRMIFYAEVERCRAAGLPLPPSHDLPRWLSR